MPSQEIIILSKQGFEPSYYHLTTLKAMGSADERCYSVRYLTLLQQRRAISATVRDKGGFLHLRADDTSAN